jgi:hypothetical protein
MLTRVAVRGAASSSAVGTRFGAVVRQATQPRHRSDSTEAYRSAGTHVLIRGAGFGGVRAALELDRCLGRTDLPDHGAPSDGGAGQTMPKPHGAGRDPVHA